MNGLVRYEKVEITIFGVIVPTCILIWMFSMINEGYSVFPGRHHLVYFYNAQSYLVSTLWLGVAFGLISRYLLRYTILKRDASKLAACYWLSLTLVCIGIGSSIWLTFSV